MAVLNEVLFLHHIIRGAVLWQGRYDERSGAADEAGWYALGGASPTTWAELQRIAKIEIHRDDVKGVRGPKDGSIDVPLRLLRLAAAWVNIGQSITWTPTAFTGWTNEEPDPPFGDAGSFMVFDLSAPSPRGANVFPGPREPVVFTLQSEPTETTVIVPCERRDFRLTDAFQTPEDGPVSVVKDSIFRVRFDASFAPGLAFTFEGESWNVQGVSRVGRHDLLDLLARKAE